MKGVMRWLRRIALWVCGVPVAPHYWFALMIVAGAFVVTWMFGWSEQAFRLAGMCLQVGGGGAVLWEIVKTRADFKQPSVRSQFRDWLNAFPQRNPPQQTVSADGIFWGDSSAVLHVSTTHGPSADQTVEGRLKHLEEITKALELNQGRLHSAFRETERKLQKDLDMRARLLTGRIENVVKLLETTATSGIHISGFGVVLVFFGTIFGGMAPEISGALTSSQLFPSWQDLIGFIKNFFGQIVSLLGSFIAYSVFYKNSRPQIIAYYQPSRRNQSMIDLVIENVGSGNAYGIKFSKPLPIGWFGISASAGEGRYIPTASSIPSLAPRQRLVFVAGQYGGLLDVLGDSGISIEMSYKFNPPFLPPLKTTDDCIISVKHLEGMATFKSMEQAVVDAIEGRNQTAVKDICESLQKIAQNLSEIGRVKEFSEAQGDENKCTNKSQS